MGSSWSGAGCIRAQFLKHGAGIFVRLQFLGHLVEVRLILAQIGPADFEQLVERQVDHLVVLKLLREGIGANAEVAVRAGKQIGLEPVEIAR